MAAAKDCSVSNDPGGLDRRTFLKLSALLGAGLIDPKWLDTDPQPAPQGEQAGSHPDPASLSLSLAAVAPAVGPASLIQGTFGSPAHAGNFEAVLLVNGELWHYYRDNTDLDSADFAHVKNDWQRGQRISSTATGPGSIIQSTFGTPPNLGNFEVVVQEGNNLVHYFHDNSSAGNPWQRARVITSLATGPGCIIQSTFGTPANPGNFEVVVLEGVDLVHYFHDNSNVNNPWTRGQVITSAATGPGCIIQSTFGTPKNPGNFEVVVLEGSNLVHYFHDNSNINNLWQRGQIISSHASGPAAMIQSTFGTPANPGNFEVGVLEGNNLVHYFHNNGNVTNSWQRGQIITTAASGPGCLLQSSLGPNVDKNFEVLVMECSQSVVHYFHPNQNLSWPWVRTKVLLGEPWPVKLSGTRKVVQLTGQYDRQGWNGIGLPALAFNQTETSDGIRGTDLGSSFLHRGRVYFLFGDTWRTSYLPSSGPYDGLDGIAYSSNATAYAGLHLTFNPQPPRVYYLGQPIAQDGFNVPLDGLSYNGWMYVFFSTGHYDIELTPIMGSSVLARSSDDGLNFTMLYTFSTARFINVTVQTVKNSAAIGLPFSGAGLLIWGSGRYRASDVFFACMPLVNINTQAGLRFYAGLDGSNRPLWSSDEDHSVPLFSQGDVGELSVRWNGYLNRWVLMYNSGNPYAILARLAPNPWGPWSPAIVVVDPADALCNYMHRPGCDHVNDMMFFNDRSNEWGGLYGPYQISHYSTGLAGYYSKIYFAMSTWNPYQAMQMCAVVTPDGSPFNILKLSPDLFSPNFLKYALLSFRAAALAVQFQTSWDDPLQGSQEAADHIEWGEFHPAQRLRQELSSKFGQLLRRIPASDGQAQAYAVLSADQVALGGGLPGESSDVNALRQKALALLQNGNLAALIQDLDQRMQQPSFFNDQNSLYLPAIDS